MSLQIWLPLIKDLKNQGLNNNIIITNNGSTFNSVGKLGGCYNFDNSMGILTNNSITLNTTFSISCWIKINSWNRNWANVFKIYKDVYDYIGLCMNQTSSTIKQLGFHIYKNNGSNACKAVYDEYYMPLTLGEWYHLCFTVTSTEIKTYQNGDCIKTATIKLSFPSISNYILNLGKGSFFGGLDCSINDFRLYDEALSPMQIKLISQGLVLHYPLDNNGMGQENLVNNSDFSNLANSGVVMRDNSVLFHDRPTCKINRTGATSNTYTGWVSQNLVERLTPGEKVTVSVWMYREQNHGIDSGCEWRMFQKYNNNTATDWTGFYSNASWPVGEWKKFVHTYTVRTDVSSAFLSFDVIRNGTYWFAEPKIEKGEIATAWKPSVSDSLYSIIGLNDDIIYDTSGFGNDGTKYNVIYNSNTAKYEISSFFNGSDSYINVDSSNLYCLFKGLLNPFSFTFWIYHNEKDRGIIFGDYGTTGEIGFNIEITAANYIRFYWNGSPDYTATSSIIPINTWTFVSITYTGEKLFIYINGNQTNSYTITLSEKNKTSGNFNIGRDHRNSVAFNGLISDFRIYATTLSQQDIKRLYLVRASIDRNANFYVGEIQEEQKKSISKNSVSSFNKYIQFNSINPNIIPNSVKMALGSANASTGTWRTAGTSNMTRTRLEILNSPIGKCYGFQNEGIQTANDGSCYGIDSFPLAANTQYTISMWARIIDGTEGYVGYNIYQLSSQDGGTHNGTIIKNYRVTKLPSNGDWMRCWYTFTTNSNTTRNIYIGVCTGEQSVTTQMCAIKIEKGNISTPWIPKEEDQNYNEYTKNIVSINKQQGIYADSFIEI